MFRSSISYSWMIGTYFKHPLIYIYILSSEYMATICRPVQCRATLPHRSEPWHWSYCGSFTADYRIWKFENLPEWFWTHISIYSVCIYLYLSTMNCMILYVYNTCILILQVLQSTQNKTATAARTAGPGVFHKPKTSPEGSNKLGVKHCLFSSVG